jgi:large subunit ribosomal protein L4
MIKINVYNQKAEVVGDHSLSKKIFGAKINLSLVHQAVVAQQANERQVLAHTKVRSEVRGGGKKPWKQKGTGRARAGSSRSPIWKGGGVTFGPRNERNFKKDINKKMKQKALFMALSDKLSSNDLVIIDTLDMEMFSTRAFSSIVTKLEKNILKEEKTYETPDGKTRKTKRSFLIINESGDEKARFSARNMSGVEFISSQNINIVDLLKYRNLLITKKAIEKMEAQYK